MHVDIPKALGQLEHFSSGKTDWGRSEEMAGLNRGAWERGFLKHLTEKTKERWTDKNMNTEMMFFGFQLPYSLEKLWPRNKDAKW